METCKFEKSWIGRCKEPVVENGMCEEHKDLKCSSCGAPATRDCEATMGLVCGAPLCDDCEHTLESNGCNSGGERPEGLKAHCKKSEQKYFPWYVTDYVKKTPELQVVIDKFNNDELTYLETESIVGEHVKAKNEEEGL